MTWKEKGSDPMPVESNPNEVTHKSDPTCPNPPLQAPNLGTDFKHGTATPFPGYPRVPDRSLPGQGPILEPFTIQLNNRWRVINDPLQFILQRKHTRNNKAGFSWDGRRFCRTRLFLLRSIRELAEDVDSSALALIEALPDWHQDFDPDSLRKRARQDRHKNQGKPS